MPDFRSLARDISALKARFQGLVEGTPHAARYLNNWDARVRDLHELVRFCIPFAVCPYCGGDGCDKCSQAGWLHEDAYNAVPREFKGGAR